MKKQNKLSLLACILLIAVGSAKGQNSPFFIYGDGLDGSIYQTSAIYSTSTSGLVLEAPKNAFGSKLPIQFSWRGGGEPAAFKIMPNGNLGIGTDNPEFKLDVKGGNANISHDKISALGGQLTISNGYGNQNVAVRLNLNNGGAVSWIKGIVTGPNTSAGSAIVFGVASSTADGLERMRITSNGDVAIGTDDTRGYKLAVAGNVIAESIKVQLKSSWPDYVFAKDHSIPSLAEIEKHVKEKGHLPGIPSAEEVKNNGIDLGEMNAKLLQKIEELTLYLIEKDKQFKELFSDYVSQKKAFTNEKKLINELLGRIELLEGNNLKR